MKSLLTSGMVGNIELNQQRKLREAVTNRWTKIGLLEGLNGQLRENIATLYENQAKHLIYEATGSENSGSFETVVFPLVRRVFSKLLTNDIVTVQAMTLPSGKLFFIRPVTSEREFTVDENEVTTGRHTGLMGHQRLNRHYDSSVEFDPKNPASHQSYARYSLPDEVVNPTQTSSNTTTPTVTQYMKKSLYDLFYNDFLFDNSKGKMRIKVGSVDFATLRPDGSVGIMESTEALPINATSNSVTEVMLQIGGFSSFNAGRLTGPDGNEMDTEAFLASLKVVAAEDITGADGYTVYRAGEQIHFRVVTQAYGTQIANYGCPCDAEGHILIAVDLSKPAAMQGTVAGGYIGIDPATFEKVEDLEGKFFVTWAQYDSLEFETELGEVSFQLTSVTVSVEERKLRATWSPELAQDVAAYHNIDAEAELTALLSEQVAAEIDREVLRDIRSAAPWKFRWDYNGWQRITPTSTVYTQKDWNQTLMTTINQISAQIQKATLRGGANWIVCSSEISAVLNDLEYFHVTDASAESNNYNMGIEKIGSLQGRYTVIVDPYSPAWSLIMGHHGTSILDTGYIYAPYIPMSLTPTMYNPFNGTPVKMISTRYAKKLVNNRYYGAVVVDGLRHFSTLELR